MNFITSLRAESEPAQPCSLPVTCSSVGANRSPFSQLFARFALFALFFDSARRRIDCKWISIVKVRTRSMNLCGKSIAHLFYLCNEKIGNGWSPSHRACRVSRAAFAKQSLAKKNGRAKCGDLVVKSLARPVPETKWMGIRTPARSYISLGLPTSAYSADELRKTSENGDST